jgi:S1-C subfamily serine protease
VLALGDPAFAAAKKPDPPNYGLLITRVEAGGSAPRAELRGGDVLLRYAGTKLTEITDLASALKTTPKGKAVVWRDSKQHTVTLGSPLGLQFDERSARASKG